MPTPPFIDVTGCIEIDDDFDGVPYDLSWPGTLKNGSVDRAIHPQPIRFSSPLFFSEDGLKYERVAFETNVIVTEAIFGNCNVLTGANCVVPPPGAAFYPLFTLHGGEEGDEDGDNSRVCRWQFGGNFIPGTWEHFGGNATNEFGPLVFVPFQNLNGTVIATDRTHWGLGKETPGGRTRSLPSGHIVVVGNVFGQQPFQVTLIGSQPRLGGLHHRYNRAA